MQINRFKGKAKGRNRCVEHGGIIYAVATAEGKNIQEQTLRSLKYLAKYLRLRRVCSCIFLPSAVATA